MAEKKISSSVIHEVPADLKRARAILAKMAITSVHWQFGE
jgi:hypothetical protein